MKWGVELVPGDVLELGGVASFHSKSFLLRLSSLCLTKISLVSIACEGMRLFWLISSALHCFQSVTSFGSRDQLDMASGALADVLCVSSDT